MYQKLTNLQLNVLHKLSQNCSRRNDMFAIFVDIESQLYKEGITDGTVLHYTLDYLPGFSLHLEMKDRFLTLTVNTGAESFSVWSQQSLLELHENCERFYDFLSKKRITLAPMPSTEFVCAINSAEKGSIINFNNQMAVICTNSTPEEKTFKQIFSGSLHNINQNSFRLSNEYIVNPKRPQDLHYLYGKAFNSLTNTADIRVSTTSDMGQYICTDIEKSLPLLSTRMVAVGPLAFTVIKDETGCCRWFDRDGKQLDRADVSIALGWAKTVLPEFYKAAWKSVEPRDGLQHITDCEYDDFLHTVKQCAHQRDYKEILDKAFSLNRLHDSAITLTIDDLEQDDSHNFIAVSYAFKEINGRRHIYKLTYEDNDLSKWPKAAIEITEDEFLRFCERKLDDSYSSLVDKNSPTAELLQRQRGITKEQAESQIIKAVESHPDYNFLGITRKNINSINQRAALLLQSRDEIPEDSLSFTEFIDYDER